VAAYVGSSKNLKDLKVRVDEFREGAFSGLQVVQDDTGILKEQEKARERDRERASGRERERKARADHGPRRSTTVQGYLAHKKPPRPRTLQ